MPLNLNWPMVRRSRLAKQAAKTAQLKEWFESAMVMVDSVPSGIAWSDPTRDFAITYINEFGRSILKLGLPAGETLDNRTLDSLFPALAAHKAAMKQAAAPVRLVFDFGPRRLQLAAQPIRNREGQHIGTMASWTDVTREHEMARSFESTVRAATARVADMAHDLQRTATGMNRTAEDAGQQVCAASDAVALTSRNLQTVVVASEELAASVQEITRQTTLSLDVAKGATEATSRTQLIVQELAEGARKIGDIIGLINGIAGQTNLLALNATIEAARAGEAGKGFAIVAGEVKSLASQTSRATEQIGAQINAIQATTRSAVEAIARIGADIAAVSGIAGTIAESVTQQGAATSEIVRNTHQVAASGDDVSRNVGGLSDTAGEVRNAAGHLLEAAASLGGETGRLMSEVDAFLAAMHAAA